MRHPARLLGVLGVLLGTACGGDGGGTAPTVTAPAPTPPAVAVSFAHDTLTVEEGETLDVEVRYHIDSLANPVSLEISPLNQGTTPEDYELEATNLEIPAGQGVSGSVTLAFRALSDRQISEGDERMALRLVPPTGVRAELGSNLMVTIADGPGVPCQGVRVQASPIIAGTDPRWLTTTLALSRKPNNGRAQFDWAGPYLHDENCHDEECREWWETRSPSLAVNVVEWRIESSSSGTHHSMDVEWYESKTAQLRFRSPDGACSGDPAVTCASSGCELVP